MMSTSINSVFWLLWKVTVQTWGGPYLFDTMYGWFLDIHTVEKLLDLTVSRFIFTLPPTVYTSLDLQLSQHVTLCFLAPTHYEIGDLILHDVFDLHLLSVSDAVMYVFVICTLLKTICGGSWPIFSWIPECWVMSF